MVQGMEVSSSLVSLQVFRAEPGDGACFPSIKISTTNGAGDRVVVGFLVAFLSIGTAEFFSADVAGIGLRRIYMGFQVSSEVALLLKLFPTFVTHVLLKRYIRNIRYVWG
jgi:hypothetical protein